MMLLAAFLVVVAFLDGSIGDEGTENSSFQTPKTNIMVIPEHVDHFGNYTKSLPSFTSNHNIWKTNVVGVHSAFSSSTKSQNDQSYSLEIIGKDTSTDLENAMTADHAQTASFSESTLDSISNGTVRNNTKTVDVTKEDASGNIGGNIVKIKIPNNIPRIMRISVAKARALEENSSNTVKRSLWNFIKDTVSKVFVPARNESTSNSTNHTIVDAIVDGASAIVKGNSAQPNILRNITNMLGLGDPRNSTLVRKNSTSFWKSIGQSISNIIVPSGNISMMNMDKTNCTMINAVVGRATCILKNNPAKGAFLNNITRMLGIENDNTSVAGNNNSTSFWKSIMDSYSGVFVPSWNDKAENKDRSIRNVIVGGASDIMNDYPAKAIHSDDVLMSGGVDTDVLKKKLDAASELRLGHIRTTIYTYLMDKIPTTSAKKGNINSSGSIMANRIVDGVADIMKFNVTEINLFRSYVESLVGSVPEFDAHDPEQFAANKHKIVDLIVQGISDIVFIDIMESVLFTSYLESLVDKIPKHDGKTMKRGLMGIQISNNGSRAEDLGSLTPQASELKMNYCDPINGSLTANCTTKAARPALSQTRPYFIFVWIGLFWAFCCLVASGFRVLRACLEYLGQLFSQ
ncbi:hypothetical protein GE061_000036 [Apolygus lucorum]|uniref:Uncharacterized protein n=1 Tax=Apolygus lucorum TaxID=248454 RepID=A0A8S9Y789_APOLU|nr:hypothetical protein GE061_000036 [Apolygus lucorum]